MGRCQQTHHRPRRRGHDWWWNKTHWRCKVCLRLSFNMESNHKLASDNAPCGPVVKSMLQAAAPSTTHDLWVAPVKGEAHRLLLYCGRCWCFAEKSAKLLRQDCLTSLAVAGRALVRHEPRSCWGMARGPWSLLP